MVCRVVLNSRATALTLLPVLSISIAARFFDLHLVLKDVQTVFQLPLLAQYQSVYVQAVNSFQIQLRLR